MKRSTHAPCLTTILTSLALVLVATFALVAAPRPVRADPSYASTPIEGVEDRPGFIWVGATETEPAHYLVYNPLEDPKNPDDNKPSHEACIGWWYLADYSRDFDFDGYLIKLNSNIDFSAYQFERDGGDPNQLSVGSEDRPFKGTFDGAGHTISNLTNNREGLSIQMDNGFFGWTNQATIKNVTVSNCYIGGSYRDGLVAGYAQDTFFLNITAEDCTTSVIPANNVLNLITNAGISGGTIAGVANGCTLYNCEMRGGRVVTNATAGVAALGGQPLYMGGLVGQANDTTIEYCRVTDKWVENEDGKKARDYAEVSGTYETAVSVANYSEVFVGGIVGGMQKEDTGTKIVDCYSTADVYGKAAIYFGVGLGLGVTRAYCGGIAGIVWDGGDGQNLIERVHYAGNLHSYQYNQLLLGIPIIQEDAYMGGIVSVGGGNVTINQAYFKRGASSTNAEILSYQNWTTDTDGPADGGVFGPRDASYTDRDYWEGCDFDFAGGTVRNAGYPFTPDVSADEWDENHYNKWVMDYNRGIPVHGGSVKATLDFPGSGEVTIGTTTLSSNDENEPYKGWLTSDPYDFAVQGFEQGDDQITLRYVLNENNKNVSWAADNSNEGYRIIGWYGTRDVQVNAIPSSHSYFTSHNTLLDTDDCGQGILSADKGEDTGLLGDAHASDGAHLVKANGEEGAGSFDLTVNWPIGDEADGNWRDPSASTTEGDGSEGDSGAGAGDDDGTVEETKPRYPEYADNDLYIAHAQAQVLLHDVAGNLIDVKTTAVTPIPAEGEEGTDPRDDDWYEYEESLPLPMSVAADADRAGTFIGWTNIANTADGGSMGYTAIGSTELTTLKQNGQFWAPGAIFTVTEPTNLYPAYSQYDNIEVIYEGHDASTLQTRAGYGTADKKVVDDGDLILSVQPVENSPLLGNDPTVRFLGWYEYVGDAATATAADQDTDPTHWLRVSRGEQEGAAAVDQDCFTFNVTDSGVELTEPHIYKARFEYRVDYLYYHIGNESWEIPYAQVWEYYNSSFDNIDGPGYRQHKFDHWAMCQAVPTNDGPIECRDGSHAVTESQLITAPIMVCAHSIDDAGVINEYDNIVVTTDFPTGPTASRRFDGLQFYAEIDASGCNSSSEVSTNPYWFHGWVYDGIDSSSESERYGTSLSNPWNFGRPSDDSANDEYWVEAHVTGRVQFHGVPDGGTVAVERRYAELVQFDAENDNAEKYIKPYHYSANIGLPQTSGEEVSSTTEPSPSEGSMSRQGYVFLGWLDMSDDDVSNVVNQITSGKIDDADAYLAKSYHSVAAYLMTGDEVCTRPMDLYPVYIGFDVDTTTNIAEARVDTSIYNTPADPSLVNEAIAGSKGIVKVAFNDEAGATVTNSNTIELNYNDAYEATVKVIVDNDQKVWANDQDKNDVYTFTSLSVYRDGELAQTVPASGFEGDAESGTLASKDAITIVVGSSYKFVANYSPVPVMVTYHYNYDGDGSTESFSAEVGQTLPAPTGMPSFSGYESAFVVGWTEGTADGAPAKCDDSPTVLTPGSDVVTGTMHLWPVYRAANFVVNSNIDDQSDSDSHRGWTKTADGQGAKLWAEQSVEVDGARYTFQGWTTQGVGGDIERTSTTWELYGNDRFPDPAVTYTAIYAQVNEIRYHDTDGNVIYTASATDDDDRTFVNTMQVEVPQYDENGKPVINEETGEQVTTTKEIDVPIDSQAFTAIAAAIDSKNLAENTTSYEQFVMWQWVDAEGNVERWGEGEDNFVNEKALDNMVDGHMDLYPVTVKLAATDPSDAAYTDLTTQLTLDEETNTLTKAMITLQSSYSQEWLKVHIEEVAYAPNNRTVTSPQTSVPVELYTPGSQIGSPVATDTTRDKDDSTGAAPLVPGDALFTFAGRITITKTATDARAAGQTFTFIISNGTDARTVSLQLPEEPTNGAYTKTATVNVPFGSYTVVEDGVWAWRYDATVKHWELDSNGETAGNQPGWVDGGEVTVKFDSTVSANNPDGVTSAVRATNTLTNNKWSDGSDYRHNVFNQVSEGSGE